MTDLTLLDATTQVALAAYLHDLGTFAERAGAFDEDPRLSAHLQLHCPHHRQGGCSSHRRTAHAALAIEAIGSHLPFSRAVGSARLKSGAGGGGSEAPANLFIDPATAEQKSETFLQWIIATADQIAIGAVSSDSGRCTAAQEPPVSDRAQHMPRLLTLFEQMRLQGETTDGHEPEWRYPLRPLSPSSVFPAAARNCEPRTDAAARAEYRSLWKGFLAALEQIPRSHRASPALWLDHFDTLWRTWAHAIPSTTEFDMKAEVSLYDHSRTTAAIAAALWRWHMAAGQTGPDAASQLAARSDLDVPKLLLVQGDFFGVQGFIFADGAHTQRQAAKLLRGRSFQVSLFSELAALRVLETLGLPPTSVVSNAAGKFLVVAPNTPDTMAVIERLRTEVDDWFLRNTWGEAGIGLAHCPVSCRDLVVDASGGHTFAALMTRVHEQLEQSKLQRFGLATGNAGVLDASYPYGPCAWNGRLPSDQPADADRPASCALSRDQIAIGESLVRRYERLLVIDSSTDDALRGGDQVRALELEVLGYRLAFATPEDASGRFGALAAQRVLGRCWDFSLPESADAPLWSGYARRNISGYVPRVDAAVLAATERYDLPSEELPTAGELKTLDMLACEDRLLDGDAWRGISALAVLKGDIDDLGQLFRVGLQQPTFAKHAALSRQVDTFFSVHLPLLLARDFPTVYTVFAGGDDFFLIGPWRTVQTLAARLRNDFRAYAAGNRALHFSVGIATQRPGAPIRSLSELAEGALQRAKAMQGKDSVTCFGETVSWSGWPAVQSAFERLEALRNEFALSTGYVYGLLQFVDMRAREHIDPAAAMWRARMAYRTRRMVVDRLRDLDDAGRRRAHERVALDVGRDGIEALGPSYRIALFNHLYLHRDSTRSKRPR